MTTLDPPFKAEDM